MLCGLKTFARDCKTIKEYTVVLLQTLLKTFKR